MLIDLKLATKCGKQEFHYQLQDYRKSKVLATIYLPLPLINNKYILSVFRQDNLRYSK